MNRGLAFLLVGVLALAGIGLIVWGVWGNGGTPAGPEPATEQPTFTPVMASATPAPTNTTAAAETPTVEVVAPTEAASPTSPAIPTPAEPSALPRLAALMEAAGMGGGSGGSEQLSSQVTLELNVDLPAGPDTLPVYVQAPRELTADLAAVIGQQWGLTAPAVYEPFYMTQGEDLGAARSYQVIDGRLLVGLDGAEVQHYRSAVAPMDLCLALDLLPPAAEAEAVAIAFLQARNLLPADYQVDSSRYAGSGLVSFYQVLEGGWVLSNPCAMVTVDTDGEVVAATLHEYELDSAGDYALISAQEAWELAAGGEPGRRVWYGSFLARPEATCTPRWQRHYETEQAVHLFGPLAELYPADPAGALYVTMNGLVLQGENLADLVADLQARRQATGDSETPFHVWGQVQEQDDVQVLELAGWESVAVEPTLWTGVIRRDGETGTLETEDGQSLTLPGLPADLPDGVLYYVSGGLWDGQLEWTTIQSFVQDEGAPAPQPAAIRALVEQVDLVYYASPLATQSQDFEADFGWRSVQPAWRLSGHTDQGTPFEILVQAVDEPNLQAVP